MGLAVNPSVVASTAHAILSGFAAAALWRGAKTFERARLARMFAATGLYSATIGISYATIPSDAGYLTSALCVLPAIEGFANFIAVGRQLRANPPAPNVPLWPRVCLAIGALSVVAFLIDRRLYNLSNLVLTAMTLVTWIGTMVVLVRSMRSWPVDAPERHAPRDFLVACLCLVIPILMWSVSNFIPMPLVGYRIIRAIGVFAFTFACIVAFFDHSTEPMRLDVRFSLGTLTIVLAVLVVVSELSEGLVAPEVRRAYSVRLWWLVVAASIAVNAVFRRIYRQTLISPLSDLLRVVGEVEKGKLDSEARAWRDDEIGSLATSFNTMLASLRQANEDLRRQIAVRSRELAEALANDEGRKSLHADTLIGDRYRVTRLLGEGGMGAVYAVTRASDDRPFAVKVMRGGTRDDAARFAREAEIASQLSHPNLVSVIDIGIWNGAPYLVMELVNGGCLEDVRARFGHDLPWARDLLRQMARGLAALHERGVVHRDLKPANVLLAKEGNTNVVKITDFGIARRGDSDLALAATIGVDAPTAKADLTRTGALVGTLPYMAPELARGTKTAGSAADMFAFGLVAYELLTGKAPFELPPVILALARKPMPNVPPLPEGIGETAAAAVLACLREDPSARPSASAMAETF